MDTERLNYLKKFNNFIDFIKAHKKINKVSKKEFINVEDFTLLCSELNELKASVFFLRFAEAKKLFEENKDFIKISSFELMEYNFHENTHTNILQYLFDFRFSGNLAIYILKSFLLNIELEESKKIASAIGNYNYYTERESYIEAGRIDLLIADDVSKFVIVIENKLLTDILEKEESENFNNAGEDAKEKVTHTQLSNYKEYIEMNYLNYTRLFILLSHKKQETIDKDYISLDYNFLLSLLKNFDVDDNILKEYKLLLENILQGRNDIINKLELGYKVVNSNNASLTEIETLKNFFL